MGPIKRDEFMNLDIQASKLGYSCPVLLTPLKTLEMTELTWLNYNVLDVKKLF
jgi:hypothetical protein